MEKTSIDSKTQNVKRLYDRIFGEMNVVVEEVTDQEYQQLVKALLTLTDREKYVIEARFLGERKKTYSEIGKEKQVSGERIRQIEAKALRKLHYSKRIDLLPKILHLKETN